MKQNRETTRNDHVSAKKPCQLIKRVQRVGKNQAGISIGCRNYQYTENMK